MGLLIDKEGLQKHREKMKQDILKLLETENRVACVQPTGIGKSYCIARLCNELKGNKLVLEPGNEVINYMQKFNIETPDADYITYYSLLKSSATDLANMFKEYDYIFLDEMHRALADKWGKQLDKTFAILDVLEAKYKILGFSATPTRMDNRDAVEEIFHGVQIEPYYLQDAIIDGILPNIEYHSSIYEITDKDKKKIELKDTPLVKQILSYDIDEGVSKIFQENLDLSQPHHIIVFVDRIVNISEAIENMKKWLKVDFSIYKAHSKMSYKESKEAIENFQKDKGLSLMFTVDILNEGVHLDKVDTSVFLRKTSSTRVYNQQLGRVISDTIENPKVFDLVNNIDNLDTGYAFMFKEKADKLNIRTEQLVTKNGEYLKITTHQEDLIRKLKHIRESTVWTEEEIQFLRENYMNKTNKELAEELNHTLFSVINKLRKMGLTKEVRDTPKRWTEEEIQFIKDNYGIITNKELAKKLNRSSTSLYTKLKDLKLFRKSKRWTKEEIQFLRDNSGILTNKELAEKLNRPYYVINYKLDSLKLNTSRNRCWTEDKILYLKNNYKTVTDKELAEKLNCSTSYIRAKLNELKLVRKVRRKPKRWTEKDIQFLKENCSCMSIKELANKLHHDKANVYYKLKELDLLKLYNAERKPKHWTKEEIQFIKDNYEIMNYKELAKELNRPVISLYTKLKDLKLSL